MAIKTQKNNKDPLKFINQLNDEVKKQDSLTLIKLFEKETGEKAAMWGDSIIGFGEYHYKYKSGQEGDWPLTGFSPRKANLSIYIMPGFKKYEAQLKKLGKHKHSVSCLYVKKLTDIDLDILKEVIKDSVKRIKEMYN